MGKKVVPIGKPIRRTCHMCNGSGTVPVDHRDPRKGDRRCPNCGGSGTVG